MKLWRQTFKENDLIGNLIFVKELSHYIKPAGQTKRVFLVKCPVCLNNFSIKFDGTVFKKKSCGCNRLLKTKHPLFPIWKGILQRCYDKNCDNYKRYGSRGIKVCERWQGNEVGFINFLEDMEATYEKGLHIDRIDNNGDYTPENCRWVTCKVNQRNKRNNKLLEHKGEIKTQAEWIEISKLTENAFLKRLKKGWNMEKIMNTPLKIKTYNKSKIKQ